MEEKEIRRGDIYHADLNPVYGSREDSVVLLEQIRTLDKMRLDKYIGRLDREQMLKIDKALCSSTGMRRMDKPECIEKNAYHTRNIDVQKTLNVEQILTLIEASKDTPIHMQVLFAVLLGLRRCEINRVKYSDIDYINRTLTVQRQLGKKPNTTAGDFPAKAFTKQEIGLKTSSSYRTVPIPDYVFEAILEERKAYEKNRRRRPAEFQDLDYVCCSSYGRPRSKEFYWKHYKKLLLKNNFNPKAVSQLMGHAKEIITIDVYGDTAEIIEDCLDEL